MEPLDSPAAPLFLTLLIAHLLGDFVVQSDVDARQIERGRVWTLARHAGQHALLAGLALAAAVPGDTVRGLFAAGLIGLSHFIIDLVKSGVALPAVRRSRTPRPIAWWIIVLAADQAAHVAMIALTIALLAARGEPPTPWWMTAWAPAEVSLRYAAAAAGFLVTVPAGAVVISRMIEPFHREVARRDVLAGEQTGGLISGGAAIGLLERTVIFLMLVTGNAGGIGLLIAAKSVFRFNELKDRATRMHAEYFLIGTLMSVAWALATGAATAALIAPG